MNRGRFPIVLLLIFSLVTAGAARRVAMANQASRFSAGLGSSGNLSQMNSYALALMLGGLRGPLVMFLWPSAEHQKNEHNLDDFDTKIEWIRLLQAEFDTVHIFQIWNKAYNISVQMANIANKYQTILDALDYGRSVDAERPNDINIIVALAQVYGDKLGTSAERQYYRQRVRDETQARQPMVRIALPTGRWKELVDQAAIAGYAPSRLRPTPDGEDKSVSVVLPQPVAAAIQTVVSGPDVTYADLAVGRTTRNNPLLRHRQLDPLLDDKGHLLPSLCTPKLPRPANADPAQEWDDGSDLQYLKQFEPFPQGVSPLALGYNYYKRAQVLQTVNGQKHVQLSDRMIGSRPAISLRLWAEEHWENGRRTEIEAFGLQVPAQRTDMEIVGATQPLGQSVQRRALIEQAIEDYARTDQIGLAAITEYQRHLGVEKEDVSLYLSHMDDIQAMRVLAKADETYLQAMLAAPSEQAAIKAQASALYKEAAQKYEIAFLRYYAYEYLLTKVSVSKADIVNGKLSQEELDRAFDGVRRAANSDPQNSNWDELKEYSAYVARTVVRRGLLGS